ncbi:unnamed protein product [Effrenium voratum]|nr:unnamed protein product [Effrenium voratum]CAJ1430396.1 unnamed protein product [Effrenium voratum]
MALAAVVLFAAWRFSDSVYFYVTRTTTTESEEVGRADFRQSRDIVTNLPDRYLSGEEPSVKQAPFFEAQVELDPSKFLDPIISSKWFDLVLDSGILNIFLK